MSRALAIETLAIRSFRNLAAVDVEPGPRFNVVSGENGQGKTNLLEAVYTVLTSKSFRATKPGELVGHGEGAASVRARILEEGYGREQTVGLKSGARMVKVDGKRAESLASYAVGSPAVVFHPGVVALSMGGGSDRRRLLDRIALYTRPASLHELESYDRAIRARQKILETRGTDARDLGEWEELIVRHGLVVTAGRRDAAQELASATQETFRRIAAPGTSLEVAYEPSAPPDAEAYRSKLVERRPADLRRGGSTFGPHRDDLGLAIDGRKIRGVASQGQHRAVVLSLKLAEIEVIAKTRGVRPILLLDDVSSELDRSRTAALFAFLREHEGQVFLSTTRPELIEIDALTEGLTRRDFVVERGVVTPVSR